MTDKPRHRLPPAPHGSMSNRTLFALLCGAIALVVFAGRLVG
jgi:hypothetical protein